LARALTEEEAVRVATYTRISTDEAHQPYSLSAQAERLGSYIKSYFTQKVSKKVDAGHSEVRSLIYDQVMHTVHLLGVEGSIWA
jgi:hypothetical protein